MELEIGKTEPCKLRKRLLDAFKPDFKCCIDESTILNKEVGFVFKEVKEMGKISLHRGPIRKGKQNHLSLEQSTQEPGVSIVGHFHSHKWVHDLRDLNPSCGDIQYMLRGNIDYDLIGGISIKTDNYGVRVITTPTDDQLIKIHKRVIHVMYMYTYSPPDRMKPTLLNASPEDIKNLLIYADMPVSDTSDEEMFIDTYNREQFIDTYRRRLRHNFGYAGNRCRKIIFE